MKICFMGTPEFAVPPLQRLIESRHEVALVVTQPSKPAGRGRRITDPPVKTLADQHGIPVLQPASLKKDPLDAKIRELGIDLVVVVAYGKILPDALLAAPRIGSLNIHASLLPEYRGAAPIQRALMEGRDETGVTIMQVVSELDAGPIVSVRRAEIHDDDDSLSMHNYLSVLGADMLVGALDEIEKTGVIEGEPQDDTLATYAEMVRKEEGLIPWSDTSMEIIHRLRALTPWPGCFTSMSGKRVRVLQAEPLGEEMAEHIKADDGAEPGAISGIEKGFGFCVRTGDGHLLITRVQPEGKDQMEALAFMNGYKLQIGDALGQ